METNEKCIITELEVRNIVEKLARNKATGTDNNIIIIYKLVTR
jgi:hypothetical protein